ncbi:MAG: hypothetical protein AB8G14_18575 [Ilumatobacter sp.]
MSSPRRRHALAAAIVGTLSIGGVIATSQLAGAAAPDAAGAVADDSAEQVVERGEVLADATVDAEFEAAFGAYDACMAEQLPDLYDIDQSTGVELIEVDPGELTGLDASDIAEWELPDNVSIQTGGEDGEWTMLDLGDGDSEITITKTDGEVEISSSGDVEEITFDAFEATELGDADGFEIDPEVEAEWEAEMEQFDAAHDTCADQLPDDVDIEFIDVTPADEVVPSSAVETAD